MGFRTGLGLAPSAITDFPLADIMTSVDGSRQMFKLVSQCVCLDEETVVLMREELDLVDMWLHIRDWQ